MTSNDPAVATAAYLAQLSPEAHEKAIAYTQGGHWLLLWGFVVSLVAAWIIVRSGVLTNLRDRLERRRRRPILTSFVVSLVFIAMNFVLTLPWQAYASWWREKSYGLNNQDFGGWLSEAVLAAGVGAILSAVFFVIVYFFLRRAPKTWWLFGGAAAAGLIVIAMAVAPVFIEPLFNTYREAEPGPVRDAVVQLARENGVPTDKVFVYDGSKQSDRYTANVSGIGGTARIAMSDAMLKRATLEEVRAVVGHEIGHYRHTHAFWLAGGFGLVLAIAFWLTGKVFPFFQNLLGANRVAGLSDPAGLPVFMAALGAISLLSTPFTNSLVRYAEEDADRYSLEHAREPDGLASALVKTIEYRASSPSVIEEILFYDHPSVENRVRRAMEWRTANAPVAAPAASPAPTVTPTAEPAADPATPAAGG